MQLNISRINMQVIEAIEDLYLKIGFKAGQLANIMNYN